MALVHIVKKFKESQSAGNDFIKLGCPQFKFKEVGTSETTREESPINLISVHVPTHKKELNDHEFGHYLAGLIDGDGHFSTLSLVIAFHSSDISLAYYLKKRLQFGNVYKVKGKHACNFILSKKEGLIKVLLLINGKMRTNSKLVQVNRIITSKKLVFVEGFTLNESLDLKNH